MKSYAVIAPPAQEPLAVTDAAAFLRLAPGAEDLATLQALLSVAREFVENHTGRALLPTGYRLLSTDWTGGQITWSGDSITLDRSPLLSVQSVKYIAAGETTLTTLAPADYAVITGTTPGGILLHVDPPALAERPDAVQIEFTAGHATAAEIPAVLLHALRLLVSNFYEQRAPINVGNITSELPLGLRHLLDSQRVGGWVG